jgi:hypothetical protein
MLRALSMRLVVAIAFLAFLGGSFTVRSAQAAEPLGGGDADDTDDLGHLMLDSGRIQPESPASDAYRFFVHGEYQLRYQAERSFLLEATATARAQQPGLSEQSLGQNQFVTHWLRLTPRFQVRDRLELVGQADLSGFVLGDKARDTSSDATPRDSVNGFSDVQPRWLYAEYTQPFVLMRVGQQPNHWGMGIFANDGDHPTLFGDYRYGQISERLLFSTTPGGPKSNLHVALAADLVFRDNRAVLSHGDRAFQGLLAAWWERDDDAAGLYTTLRHQERDRTSGSDAFAYTDQSDTVAIDVHAKIARPLPGDADAFVFAEAEAATVLGKTNAPRTIDATTTDIRSYGGAATLGMLHRSWSKGDDPEEAVIPFGDLVGQVELGYASGDANPYDGKDKRFTFDPNHRIGLLLFDEVLRFQTARAATAARDPLLGNATRPPPGIAELPSNGGVFGAQYLNPTVVVRPRHWLDLKGGVVVAQATSDVVDPYRTTVTGTPVNYRGGDPKKKDLGVELDGGVEARFGLGAGLVAQAGVQAGVLLPGSAFDDATGATLSVPWIVIGRLGVQF